MTETSLVVAAEIDQVRLMQWATAMQTWLKNHENRSIETRRTYEAAWKSFIRYSPVMPWAVTPDEVTGWVAALKEQKRAARTINLYLAAVSAFYEYCSAVYPPLTGYNPTKIVDRMKIADDEPDAVAPHEYTKLMAAIPAEGLENLRDRAMIATFWFTAMRSRAVRELRLRQITREGGEVFITYFSKKPDKKRYAGPAWEHAEAYLASRTYRREDGTATTWLALLHDVWAGTVAAPEWDWVFVSHASNASWMSVGKALSETAMSNMLDERGLAAVGRKIHAHMFRHGAARALDEAGADIREINGFLRHRTLTQTDLYLQRLKKTKVDNSASAMLLRVLGL